MEFPASSCALGLLLLLLTLGADPSWAASWTYKGDTGPHHWHELFPQACSGKYQSPIDIQVEQTMYNPDLRDFAIWYDPPKPDSSMTVLNNGHTVQVVTDGQFFVTNAGLPYVYKTAQFHFHWGHAPHHGSEHYIDSKAYPLELHIVNYNSDLYADIGAAVTEKQGLAVLGVMFEISEEDNEDLEPVIAAMEQTQDPESRQQVEIEALSLRRLLPDDITQYYRYNGSLTTPGCFESVIWTVFANPQTLSKRQMHKFRQQLGNRHKHHHKRSLPATRQERRRERRALQVLDELALTPEQEERFRRDLTAKKEHAEETVAKMDEENAQKTHHRTLAAVHKSVDHHDDDDDDDEEEEVHVSEVEMEYIQENLVNNFRPVQPLNGRTVYRSFKLRDCGCTNQQKKHSKVNPNLPDTETIRERLKMYGSTDGAGSSAISLLLLALSCLAALFL
ncbi:carbonic anhydrase 13-like [Babylonia areolata]|uniref:carbonic anhydrase 13-like n=1 Tax=Babylonia areolata TaxID=304850 RepID=UPI003FD278E4